MLDEKRMNRVLEKLDTDQMLITDPFAIYYLTGRWIFAGERFLGLLIKKGKILIFFKKKPINIFLWFTFFL